MIVVVVAEKDGMNRRQIVKAQAGSAVALRAGKGNGAGAARPDGISKEIAAGSLEQDGGMIDESHAQLGTVDLGRWGRAGRRGNPRGPRAGFPVFDPTIELAETVVDGSGIQEAAVAEMIAQMILGGLDAGGWEKRKKCAAPAREVLHEMSWGDPCRRRPASCEVRYSRRKLAGTTGLEPATSAVTVEGGFVTR